MQRVIPVTHPFPVRSFPYHQQAGFLENFPFVHRNLLKKKERMVYPCTKLSVLNPLDLREDMPLSCEEYRQQQQLLALRRRLAEDHLKPEEREDLEKLVQELERKLKI
jgi:hypothetical protein